MAIFFTSDTHFNHVLAYETYCPRRHELFSSLEEMNEALIVNWNSIVGPEDTVYHLGDFAMGDRKRFMEFRRRLNGHIILIFGNHDVERGKKKHTIEIFGEKNVFHKLIIDIDGVGPVQLSHSPSIWQQENGKGELRAAFPPNHECIFPPERDYEGWSHCGCGARRRRTDRALDPGVVIGLCGHVHQAFKISPGGSWINVGVDVMDYRPVGLQDVIDLINSTKTVK
jgi:calcineurin-like phosphoesterase family protein